MEQTVFWIGIAAALLITAANFPQAWKMIRTGNVTSISLWTYSLLVAGNVGWLAYGILREDVPLIICNTISTLLCVFILLLKLFPSVLGHARKTAGK